MFVFSSKSITLLVYVTSVSARVTALFCRKIPALVFDSLMQMYREVTYIGDDISAVGI